MKAPWELAPGSWQSPLHPCPPPNRPPAIWTCVITERQRSTPSHPHLLQGKAPPGGLGPRGGEEADTESQGDKEARRLCVTDP